MIFQKEMGREFMENTHSFHSTFLGTKTTLKNKKGLILKMYLKIAFIHVVDNNAKYYFKIIKR